MSVSEWFVRHLTYPLHERLRGRCTLAWLRSLAQQAEGSPDVVREESARRLRALLSFASEHLPYYRDVFAERDLDPRAEDPYAELARLPLLEKSDVRAHAGRMVHDGVAGGLIPHSSGGTSGDTLHFFIDRLRAAQPPACRLFMQSQFGVRPGDRRVYLWGSPIEARAGRVRRYRDRLLNEKLLDAFELGPAKLDAHLAAIRSFRPRLIYAYPSAAARLARHAARRYGPRDFPWLRLVVLTGEEVDPEQAAQVRTTFGCPVASEYGSREIGLIAHECPHGGLHIFSPHVHVELLADGRPVGPGQAGEVVCTTLTTRGQPFIRYRLGDLGLRVSEPCACGLPLPRMRLLGGKVTGLIALRDGRLCHGAATSHLLRDEPGIVQFRTVQHELDRFEVLLVVDSGFDPATIARVQRRYKKLFGSETRVDCRVVDRIPPDPSGKHRYVVSNVAPDCARFEVVHTPETVDEAAAVQG